MSYNVYLVGELANELAKDLDKDLELKDAVIGRYYTGDNVEQIFINQPSSDQANVVIASGLKKEDHELISALCDKLNEVSSYVPYSSILTVLSKDVPTDEEFKNDRELLDKIYNSIRANRNVPCYGVLFNATPKDIKRVIIRDSDKGRLEEGKY